MDRLVQKAIAQSQSFRVAKLRLKSQPRWSPDITIARDPGSGGHLIAKKLAKKLGWTLFDEKFSETLSQELGIPADEFAHVDEHSRSWLSDLFNSVFNPSYVSDIRYINHLKRLLDHVAKQGDVVILGHGADRVLPQDKCLRVRITAPFSTRVKNTYKFEKKASLQEAAEWVEHVEKRRNQFMQQYFGVNPHNPWNYDLIISTENLSLDQATQLIMHAFFIKFPGERRKLKT